MIPDYQTLMLPVLKSASQGEIKTTDVIDRLALEFNLTEEEKNAFLPSGGKKIFYDRVHWAKSYLKQSGLLHYPSRGYFELTDAGRAELAKKPKRIDNQYLEKFEGYRSFKARLNSKKDTENEIGSSPPPITFNSDLTPDEALRSAHRTINDALASDLLQRVREASPQFFEELIISLLVAMGYGGSSEEAGQALGKSGDDGVDGVIDQDPLGVDQIYVQAKRYAEGNNVGSPAIRDFFGALSLKKAQKGIFFTTSKFSTSGIQTAKELGMRIVLIDGQQLTKLMIRYNIGCRDEEILHLKKVDEEFFE
ncbi:restriction endonuclease [Kiloniella litopenaei]|uniref:Restriction endonuclease n=1 Tax=Kiloniella litopenaei TaxID=1549748 RepID=A0A0M2REK4_9PROT|nr:restriction endonuclease [Kiloniella litopenaei]KKJ78003.1 restriction endonuclease [Kiloniella litopenaei]